MGDRVGSRSVLDAVVKRKIPIKKAGCFLIS
jgi:hypothetical protein